MLDAVSTALSGLNSAQRRLAVSAENISKAHVEGRYPKDSSEKTDAYLPKDVYDTSLITGGVLPETFERQNGYRANPNPDHPKANENGLTAMPDVRIDEEIVNSKLAEISYAANASVIKAQMNTEKRLLDILA